MNQGDVFWCRFAPPDKRRPVVVLTRTRALGFLNRIVVAAVTTNIRGIGSEVPLTRADGMPEECVVTLDNIHTVDVRSLETQITVLSRPQMQLVRKAIEHALGFREMSR